MISRGKQWKEIFKEVINDAGFIDNEEDSNNINNDNGTEQDVEDGVNGEACTL